LFTFGTSPNGLGLSAPKFWNLSYREYKAHERVWERPHKEQRRMWAQVMEGLYAEFKKPSGARFTMWDWLPEEKPQKQPAKMWTTEAEAHAMMRTQSVEEQKLAVRQMISFAWGMVEGRREQQEAN
jgi:hypothetical protein